MKKVTKPLIETSRRGYLAALSASSYSYVSLLKYFGPLMNEGVKFTRRQWFLIYFFSLYHCYGRMMLKGIGWFVYRWLESVTYIHCFRENRSWVICQTFFYKLMLSIFLGFRSIFGTFSCKCADNISVIILIIYQSVIWMSIIIIHMACHDAIV